MSYSPIILRVKELIKSWASCRGYVLKSDINVKDDELVFLEGNNTIYIKIAYIDIPTEDFVSKEIGFVAKERLKYNKAYIALPKETQYYLDVKYVKELQLGVLLYDINQVDPNQAVIEVISSPAIPTPTYVSSEDLSKLSMKIVEFERSLSEVKSTIDTILSRLDNLDKRLSKIRDLETEISNIKSELRSLKSVVESLRSRITQVQVAPTIEKVEEKPSEEGRVEV